MYSLTILKESFGIRPAVRNIKHKGPYILIRHPIYFSYILSDIGLVITGFNKAMVICILIGWIVIWLRIKKEEDLLKYSEKWVVYCKKVKFKLVPFIY